MISASSECVCCLVTPSPAASEKTLTCSCSDTASLTSLKLACARLSHWGATTVNPRGKKIKIKRLSVKCNGMPLGLGKESHGCWCNTSCSTGQSNTQIQKETIRKNLLLAKSDSQMPAHGVIHGTTPLKGANTHGIYIVWRVIALCFHKCYFSLWKKKIKWNKLEFLSTHRILCSFRKAECS